MGWEQPDICRTSLNMHGKKHSCFVGGSVIFLAKCQVFFTADFSRFPWNLNRKETGLLGFLQIRTDLFVKS